MPGLADGHRRKGWSRPERTATHNLGRARDNGKETTA